MQQTLLLSTLFLPLALALLLLLFKDAFSKISGIATTATLGITFLWSLWACYNYTAPATYSLKGILPALNIDWTIDSTSLLLLLIVQFTAACVALYSTAYLKEEPRFRNYFVQLSFFCFAMNGLLLAGNLLLFYAFWELVGFASYLLIGFWNDRQAAVLANKKAFIMNRIGDACLLSGILLLYATHHTFNISTITESGSQSTLIGILLALGAFAKSAQFPLHTWLPDAMEGPTPVSALIHAATMVAAGVYLLIRLFPLFSPDALQFIAICGAFSAFMAASTALVQNDTKKILAFSTISQLGLMVSAIGMGAPGAALVHLCAHAFFKCLLFLSIGVIIKNLKGQVAEPQDLLKNGGLRKLFPISFYCYTLAALALIGAPFTSGFLSKDFLLGESLAGTHNTAGAIIILFQWACTLLTPLYLFRQWYFLFIAPEIAATKDLQVKEYRNMTVPMLLLAIGCLAIPFSLLPGIIIPPVSSWSIPCAATLLSAFMVFLAHYQIRKVGTVLRESSLHRFLAEQWLFNALYEKLFVLPCLKLAAFCAAADGKVLDGSIHQLSKGTIGLSRLTDSFDRIVVDGFVNGIAGMMKSTGKKITRLQNGNLQWYLAASIAGIVLLFCFLL